MYKRVNPFIAGSLVVASCGGGNGPTAPSSTTPTGTPATAPFTLSRGDTYRLTFRVDSSAWAGSAPPDMLIIRPDGGAECDGGGFAIDVFDGSRRIGTQSDGICGPNTFAASPSGPFEALMDFGPITSGSIDGRVELRFVGRSGRFDGLFALRLGRKTGPSSYSIVPGVTVTSQVIVR